MNSIKTRLQEGTTQIKMRTQQVINNVAVFFNDLFTKGYQLIKVAIDYTSPYSENPNESELSWVVKGAYCIGRNIPKQNPFEAYCEMSEEERMNALKGIVEDYARTMGIEVSSVQFSNQLEANTIGYYRDQTKEIVFNKYYVTSQPITVEYAKIIILTAIHETFHAFQYKAMYEPHRYNVPEVIAKYWRDNAKNYCTFEQNPSYYRLQPLESYARNVEEQVLEVFNNEELVNELLEKVLSESKEANE